MLAGEGEEQRKLWRNWCIKGFNITIAGKPLTVLMSFTDSSGKCVDDLRILSKGQSVDDLFNEMRKDALHNRVGKENKSLLAFAPKPPIQIIKQQTESEDLVASQTNLASIPIREASDADRPTHPASTANIRTSRTSTRKGGAKK